MARFAYPVKLCVCVCVCTSGHFASVRLTLCALKAGRPVHSCLRGMRPGREPHRNNNSPHQRSSIGGTWLSTFILWVYESSLRQSITHWHGEGREKRGWFAKYKLTTNWSLTYVFILFFFLLLTISPLLFNSTSLKIYTVNALAGALRMTDGDNQSLIYPSGPLSHIKTSQFQSHYSQSALYLKQMWKKCQNSEPKWQISGISSPIISNSAT